MFKTSLSVLLSLLFLFLSAESALLFAHSPHDNVQCLLVSPDYENDSTLFCSITHINNYILKSTDGGLTWDPSQQGFPHSDVSSMAISPAYATDGTLFTATLDSGVFRSTNFGANWEATNTGVGHMRILSVVISPDFANDQTVFLGTRFDGVLKSVDGGTTWSPSSNGLTIAHVFSVAVSPSFASDQTLLAGTGDGLFLSIDGGATWVAKGNSQGEIVGSVCFSPAFSVDQTAFIGVWQKGIFKTIDGGITWSPKNTGLISDLIMAVSATPSYYNDQTLFAATKVEGVFKSTNGGDSWALMNEGLDNLAPQSDFHYFGFGFSPDFEQDQLVFLAAFEGVHKSLDNATRWRHLNVYSQNLVRTMVISPDYANDETVFGGAYGGGLYRTEDGGATWEPKDTGLQSMKVSSIAISHDYANDGTLYTGFFSDAAKSTVKGDSWFNLEVNPQDWIYLRSMAVCDDGTVFAGNGDNGAYAVYRSVDGGDTFVPLSSDFKAAYFLSPSPDFSMDYTVFAGTDKGIYRTENGGNTWKQVSYSDVTILAIRVSPDYTNDGTVFAGSLEYGLFKSNDYGLTWQPANNGMDGVAIEAIDISPDFATDQTLFAATKSRGVFKSVDGGSNWFSIGLAGHFLRSLVVSPEYSTDQTLFVGDWKGIYRTVDDGYTWESVLHMQRYDDQNEFIVYSTNWKEYKDSFASGTGVAYTFTRGKLLTFSFYGDSVRWIGEKAPFAGIGDVYIDGAFKAHVDLYAAQVEWQQNLFYRGNLGQGFHNITIIASGDRNPLSTGIGVIVDAIDVGY